MAYRGSKAELARLLGLSAMAVSKKIRPDSRGSIADAVRGEFVDFDHPAVRAWAAEHDVDLTARLKERVGGTEPPTKRRRGTPEKADDTKSKVRVPRRGAGLERERAKEFLDDLAEKLEEDIGSLVDVTLLEVVERWGTQAELKEWLHSVKTVEEIRTKRLSNAETQGALISREFVTKHVLAHIDATNKKLLQDAPSKLANDVVSLCKTGASLEDVERAIRDQIGAYLTEVKNKTVRTIRNA